MDWLPNRAKGSRPNEDGRVVRFPRRAARPASRPATAASAPAEEFADYERDPDEPADDRHRMLMNFIAIAIVTLLIGAGVWIADVIGDMERDQDCVMQGRANCAPIEAPVSSRR